MAAPGPTPFLYTAFYDPDEGVPQLPQCVQRLVTIKPLRGRGIAYRPDFPGMENVILRMYDGNTH